MKRRNPIIIKKKESLKYLIIRMKFKNNNLVYIYGDWDPKLWHKVVIFSEYICGDELDGFVGIYKF